MAMNQEEIPAPPVVIIHNLLSLMKTLIIMDSNGCSNPGIGIGASNNILYGCGIGIVNLAANFPGAEYPLQDLQGTRQILLTRL